MTGETFMPYTAGVLLGWHEQMRSSGQPYLYLVHRSPESQESIIRDLTDSRPRVVAIMLSAETPRRHARLFDSLVSNGTRLVFILDRPINYEDGSFLVGHDEQQGLRMALDAAQAEGHSRVAYVAWRKVHFTSEVIRNDAFQEEIAGRDGFLSCDAVMGVNDSPRRLLKDLLSRRPAPTALFAEDGRLARMLSEAALDLNVPIPKRLSLVSLFESPPEYLISAVCPDEREIGGRAARLALALLEENGDPERDLLVKPKWVHQATLGAATRNTREARSVTN